MRSTSPLTPYLALIGALLFTVAGFVSSVIAVPLLVAGVLLGAFTLLTNLRWSSLDPWNLEQRGRRKR
jgi:hypothetical protein